MGGLGIIALLAMLIPAIRGWAGRMPGFLGIALILGSVVALGLGLLIFIGQPWLELSILIEYSTLLIPLAIGAIGFNLAWVLAQGFQGLGGVSGIIGLVMAVIALFLIILPTAQILLNSSSYEATMKKTLGDNYFSAIPPELRSTMLTAPFNLNHLWDDYGVKNDQFVYVENLSYRVDGNSAQRLDVYHPPLRTGGENNFPTIVVIHGGGWQNGNKNDVLEFNRYMAARGWVVFALDYRLAPENPFPAASEDIQCALAYVNKNGTKYGADLDHLGILGRSAGGNLALYAAYNPNPLPGAAACGALPTIRSVVALYPPTDLTEWYRKDKSGRANNLLVGFLGGTPDQKPEQYQAASPVSYINQKLPPTLLFEAGRDQFDLGVQTALLADKLKATPNKVVHLTLGWAGHAYDFVFSGGSSQISLYHIERFFGYTLYNEIK